MTLLGTHDAATRQVVATEAGPSRRLTVAGDGGVAVSRQRVAVSRALRAVDRATTVATVAAAGGTRVVTAAVTRAGMVVAGHRAVSHGAARRRTTADRGTRAAPRRTMAPFQIGGAMAMARA